MLYHLNTLFIIQLRRPTAVPFRMTMGYLARFLVCFLTLEFILHFMYVIAIKDTKAWAGTTAAELCMIGFWNLIIVWLKVCSTCIACLIVLISTP